MDKLKEELKKLTKKEVRSTSTRSRPELDAKLVADSISRQIEGRISYRRAAKMAIAASMRMVLKGSRCWSVTSNGAEIARSEMYKDGRTPLHTFHADIDFIGRSTYHLWARCQVWIMKGEVYESDLSNTLPAQKRGGKGGARRRSPRTKGKKS